MDQFFIIIKQYQNQIDNEFHFPLQCQPILIVYVQPCFHLLKALTTQKPHQRKNPTNPKTYQRKNTNNPIKK